MSTSEKPDNNKLHWNGNPMFGPGFEKPPELPAAFQEMLLRKHEESLARLKKAGFGHMFGR